jgi:hypothetical protein
MHVNDVQNLIEQSVSHYAVADKTMYALPWRATRLTNKLRALKEAGLLPSGIGGRHAPKLSTEQVGLIVICSMIGVTDPEMVVSKVQQYTSLQWTGKLKISLIRRLEIALGSPQEAAKVNKLYLEQTFPYVELHTDEGVEVYTIDGDATRKPPVTGSGQGAYLGHSAFVNLGGGTR